MGTTKVARGATGCNAASRTRKEPAGVRVEAWGFRSQAAVYEDGVLLCVCLYRRGAETVASRIAELRTTSERAR